MRDPGNVPIHALSANSRQTIRFHITTPGRASIVWPLGSRALKVGNLVGWQMADRWPQTCRAYSSRCEFCAREDLRVPSNSDERGGWLDVALPVSRLARVTSREPIRLS